jgi:hypothetical protein
LKCPLATELIRRRNVNQACLGDARAALREPSAGF